MQELIKLECYIEEYRNQKNLLSARLRDKKTNRRINKTKREKYKFSESVKRNIGYCGS